jgi:hypothetical protein
MALQWLNQMPKGRVVVQSDVNRVRALLARHPNRIWEECGHWLSLANEWVSTASLEYALTMPPMTRWSHLHQAVKQKTADLQHLPTQISEAVPFSGLPRLAGLIEERFDRNPRITVPATRRAWLNQIGKDLERIELPDEAETARVRAKASELAETQWQAAQELHLIPYIEGTPAGTPRNAEAIWFERVLYVEDRSMAKLARAVSQEIGRAFRPDVEDAIKFCFERSTETVTEYLEEVFTLTAKQRLTEVATKTAESESIVARAVIDQANAQPTSGGLPEDEVARPETFTLSPPHKPENNAVEFFSENEQIESEPPDGQVKPHRTHQVAKPPKPSIMERLALQKGYRKDSNDRFFHPDGSWISKPNGNRFWERHTATGHVSHCYWPRDHCLEREPLEIEADIWSLIASSPEIYAVVLSDVDENPVEIIGTRLLTMRDTGEIQLFPASWRLKKVPSQSV